MLFNNQPCEILSGLNYVTISPVAIFMYVQFIKVPKYPQLIQCCYGIFTIVISDDNDNNNNNNNKH